MSLNLDKRNWKLVRLGDIATASKERCDPADGTVDRFVAGEHMETDNLRIERWGEVGDGYLGPAFHRRFRPGQVLYGSRRTYLRKVAVAEFDGVCANTTFVVDANPEQVLPEFLPFIMMSEPFHTHAIVESKGSVNPYVNWSDLAWFEFDLPPLDEQKRIADLLWALERHRNALMAAMTRATLARDDWLDGLFMSSGWPSASIADLVTAGPTNGKSAKSNDEGRGVPTLSISAIRGGYVRGGASVKYMDISPNEVEKFVIKVDDFLVVRGNGNKQLTGRGGLAMEGLPEGCVYPDLLIRLRFNPDRILPAFAAAQWNSSRAHAALLQNAKSTNGIWKINGQDVRSHRLMVPPTEAQRSVLDRLKVFDGIAAAIGHEVASLDTLRIALLDDIFGGVA